MNRVLRSSLVVFLLAGGLAACGKRGHLEPPPGTPAAAPAQTAPAQGQTTAPGAGQTKLGGSKRTPIVPPKRDLVIDRLLD